MNFFVNINCEYKIKCMDEKELIVALKKGSKSSFTALYNKYWSRVYNFSRLYLNRREAAEEIVQEVFVKLWEAREFLNENENFKGFLFIITRNLIFNQSRKYLNEDFYKVSVLNALEESYSIESEIDAKDLYLRIDLLIKELPPQRQLIFNLSRKEYKSYKEIALQLNISEKTVERQISEAIKFLRKNL